MLIVYLAIAIAAYYVCLRLLRTRKANAVVRSMLTRSKDVSAAIAAHDAMISSSHYCDYREREAWRIRYCQLAKDTDIDLRYATIGGQFLADLKRLKSCCSDLNRSVDRHNEEYIEREAESMKPLLERCGIPSNDAQRRATACDEVNSLIVAGAGTGKTTTIQAKLAHLIHAQGVSPSEILLMTFTRKAGQELVDRLGRISPELTINTFHAFGYGVLKDAGHDTPDILFQNDADLLRFINDALDILFRDSAYLQKAVDFFSYYLHPVAILPGFDTLDDYYNYRETENILTFRKELVKSQQEAMIANWLHTHNINYQYERPYEHKTSDSKYRQYSPDFYLTDYGIYLEHFGVGRDGRVHFGKNGSSNESINTEYRAAMVWKRDLHRSKATRLIETYSYEFAEGNWQQLLEKKLVDAGVKIGTIDFSAFINELRSPESVRELSQLMGDFLNLFKSSGKNLTELRANAARQQNVREVAFLDLFGPVFESYQRHLKETPGIDFHDMLGEAAAFIETGKVQRKYRYLVVDEFQDISVSKYRLMMALRQVNPELKMYCVGDDWQSIFRFTGSDVTLMADFEKYFGFTRRMMLEVSNRFCEEVAKTSNDFVLQNPIQIKKTVQSEYVLPGGGVQVIREAAVPGQTAEQILGQLDALAKRHPTEKGTGVRFKVFILGRYSLALHKNHDSRMIKRWQDRFSNLDIIFSTVHSAKGLTSDFTIIIDVLGGRFGFPCRVQGDPLLNLVLREPEDFPFAEERRLMYVALTRARHKAFILTKTGRESPFAFELSRVRSSSPSGKCPRCGGRLTLRTGPYGEFVGCSNYPRGCEHKLNLKRAPEGMREAVVAAATDDEEIVIPGNVRLASDNKI